MPLNSMRNSDQIDNQQTFFDLLLWQAAILAKKGKYLEAEQLLSNLQHAPNQQRARSSDLLAKIMIRQKRFSQARSLWQTALALDPENINYQKAIKQLPRFKRISVGLPYLHWAVIVGFCICLLFSLYKITPAERIALPVARFDKFKEILLATSISDQSPETILTTSDKSSLNGSTQTMIITSTEGLGTGITTDTEGDVTLPTITKEEPLQVAVEDLIEEPDEILIKNHMIQFGESLSALARQYFQDSSKFYLLVNANKDRYPSLIDNPDNIRPGWVLVIPSIENEVQ